MIKHNIIQYKLCYNNKIQWFLSIGYGDEHLEELESKCRQLQKQVHDMEVTLRVKLDRGDYLSCSARLLENR